MLALLREVEWSSIRNDGRVNVESILGFQKWAAEQGHLDRMVRAEEIWDDRFVTHANDVLRRRPSPPVP